MSRRLDAPDRVGGPAGTLLLASGVDVVSIARIGDLVERFGDSFLGRVYTPAERAYCRERPRPAQHYAARWAAKEAAVKALPDGEPVPLGAVGVRREGDRPVLDLSGPAEDAADRLAEAAGIDAGALRAGVSLSHDRTAGHAVAHVVLGRGGE